MDGATEQRAVKAGSLQDAPLQGAAISFQDALLALALFKLPRVRGFLLSITLKPAFGVEHSTSLTTLLSSGKDVM